jgi:hypothetical protein
MYRRIPLGLSDELPPPEGTAPYGSGRIPRPLGMVTDEASDRTPGLRPAAANEPAAGGYIDLPFMVGADTYRLRETRTRWRLSANEAVVSPSDAVAIIEQAVVQHQDNAALLSLLETVALQLAGVHPDGTFVLIRLRTEWRARHATGSPPPPAARSAPAPAPSPAVVEEAPLAAAQAATLKDAAVLGVPFCEMCQRAQAAG